MGNLLTAALKDNSFLERGVLTGILRTAKERIFSGLNNLNVCTFLSEKFSQHFDLLQNEVDLLLQDYQLADKYDSVSENDTFQTYCVNTSLRLSTPSDLASYDRQASDNAIIKRILIHSNNTVKAKLKNILNNIPVTKEIDDAMIFPGIELNEKAIWSFLFFSGYLTYSEKILTEKGENLCTLSIPNREIAILYEKLLTSFFNESLDASTLKALLPAMTGGDLETFSATLQEFLLNSMSHHDFSAEEPEKSYHLFVLGLLVILTASHFLKKSFWLLWKNSDIIHRLVKSRLKCDKMLVFFHSDTFRCFPEVYQG